MYNCKGNRNFWPVAGRARPTPHNGARKWSIWALSSEMPAQAPHKPRSSPCTSPPRGRRPNSKLKGSVPPVCSATSRAGCLLLVAVACFCLLFRLFTYFCVA